jgi:hypothetical protein
MVLGDMYGRDPVEIEQEWTAKGVERLLFLHAARAEAEKIGRPPNRR